MPRRALPALCVIFMVLTVSSHAKPRSYPEKAPAVTLDIPDAWQVSTEDDVLHASPKDGSVYLGLWSMEAASMEKAFEGLDAEIEAWITDLETGDATETKINGIPFLFVDGEGKDKDDGTKVRCSAAVLAPAQDRILVLLYFGTPESEAKHEKTLQKIVQSIARAKGAPVPSDEPRNTESLAGTTWSGTDSDGDSCVFTFERGGTLAYKVPTGSFKNGTWHQFNKTVYFETNDHHSEFLGEISAGNIEGKAWNAESRTWRWKVAQTK